MVYLVIQKYQQCNVQMFWMDATKMKASCCETIIVKDA